MCVDARRSCGPSLSATRLNPAAASFEDAVAIAERLGGDEAAALVGGDRYREYRGPIVGETSLHWLQRTAAVAVGKMVSSFCRTRSIAKRGITGSGSNSMQGALNARAAAALLARIRADRASAFTAPKARARRPRAPKA